MSSVLVVGGTGMLGHKLCEVLSKQHRVVATFRTPPRDLPAFYGAVTPIVGVDAQDEAALRDAFGVAAPDVVVNAVGIVKQRTAGHDPIASILVNALLPHRLAALCGERGARLIHVSTDCVFFGDRGRYSETDRPDPVDLYGRSKLLGEVIDDGALTIRTSMIGRELGAPAGLLEWFLGHAGGRVRGYARAIFSGLTTRALAETIGAIIARGSLGGLWHVGAAPIDKYDLLMRLDGAFGTRTTIERDESVVIDRSLDSTRFWSEMRREPPTWDEMIEGLVTENELYSRKVVSR